MNNINQFKMSFCAICGIVSAFIANMFGGWTQDMTTLVAFMGVDFGLGLLLAFVFKNSNKTDSGAVDSKACFKGLCKKCVMLLCVLCACRLDITLGTNYIKTATIIGFITNELISIIENVGLMGIPLPPILTKAIDVLKSKSDTSDVKKE